MAITREEAIEEISRAVLKDRQNTYGPPESSFSLIADFWTTYLSRHKDGPLHPHDVAAMMILLKVARSIINPQHSDNWMDAGGYAVCGVELATLQQFIGGLASPVAPKVSEDSDVKENETIWPSEAAAARIIGKHLAGTTLVKIPMENDTIITRAINEPHKLTRNEYNRLMSFTLTH